MSNSKVKIIVKPVPRASVQGRHLQEFKFFDGTENVRGQAMRKNKAALASGESCSDVFVFRRDATGTKMKAGLDEAVPNFFKDMEVTEIVTQYSLPSEWMSILSGLRKQEMITKQQELEIKSSVLPGSYTQEISKKKMGGFVKDEDPLTYLQTFKLTLYDRANVFDSNTPRSRMAIQLIKNRPDKIAPSFNEINSATHSWYIAQEDEEFVNSKKKNDLVNEAIYNLVNLQMKYTFNEMYQIAALLKDKNNNPLVRGSVNMLFLETSLNDYIKIKGTDQTKNVTKFLATMELFEKNRELFHVTYLVQQAFNTNEIFINNGYLFWRARKIDNIDWYKFTSKDNFISFILTEMSKYDPNEPNMENGYSKLVKELKDTDKAILFDDYI